MRLKQVMIWGDTTTYAYNGDGDRIEQTVGVVTTTYVIDTATPLTMVLAETTNGQTIRYWHGLDVIAQSDGTNIETFGYDGLGSVRQLADSAGGIGLAQTFDPYGNTYSRSGTQASNFGYTGEYQDENGLLFLRARYYDARQGRFSQTDPSRMEQNPYAYGLGNPILYTDPSGLGYDCSLGSWSEDCYNISQGWYPNVDPSTGHPIVSVDGRYLTYEGTWHSPQARRDRAAELAKQFAPKSWAEWKLTGFASFDGTETECNDCARFVSYILWRVGFRMVGQQDFRKSYVYTAKNYGPGWWANFGPEAPDRNESQAWANVDAFYAWWKARGATPIEQENFASQLDKGDIIFYGNDAGGGRVNLTHEVMVVDVDQLKAEQGILVAGRGNCNPDTGGNPYGRPQDWYNNSATVGKFGPIRKGLHMPYETSTAH
jgi:RHS repeat-associated protein